MYASLSLLSQHARVLQALATRCRNGPLALALRCSYHLAYMNLVQAISSCPELIQEVMQQRPRSSRSKTSQRMTGTQEQAAWYFGVRPDSTETMGSEVAIQKAFIVCSSIYFMREIAKIRQCLLKRSEMFSEMRCIVLEAHSAERLYYRA